MDVQEIRKIDAYLKRLFGNPKIRVVPARRTIPPKSIIGEDDLGVLFVDDEDDDKSYNFQMAIQVSTDLEPAAGADARRISAAKFDNEKIRVVTRPKKIEFARSLSRRGFSRRAVPRSREGPQVLHSRIADPRRRSRRRTNV